MAFLGSFSKIKLKITAGVCAAIACCGGCGREHYYSRTWIEDVRCLYTDNEAYLLIQTAMSVQSRSSSSKLRDAAGLYPARGEIRRIRDDLIVFHVKDGRCVRFDQGRFGQGGGGFFFEGQLYFLRGAARAADWPVLFKWTGTNFVRLRQEQALLVVNAFKDTEELRKREGWNEFGAVFNRGKRAFPFVLNKRQLALILQQDAGFYDATLSISIAGFESDNEKLLLIVDQRLETISKEEIEKLVRAALKN